MRKMTQADRDAGLTQEDVDAGLRGGKQSSITDAERESAIARANRLSSPSIVDQYRDYEKNPEAKSFPIDANPRATPRAASRPVTRSVSPAAGTPRANITEMPEEGASSAPGTSRRAPSRGSYDRNGPIGDLIDIIRNNARRGRGNPNPNIYRNTPDPVGAKKGGSVNKMVKKASSASKRGDGCAVKGKTKGTMR